MIGWKFIITWIVSKNNYNTNDDNNDDSEDDDNNMQPTCQKRQL